MKSVKKKIAVVLSGCGNKDGTEITEAVSLWISLSQYGAETFFFAPNSTFTPQNFLTNEALESPRNMMIEAARLTRSKIQDLADLDAKAFDALIFPGGYGVALHLCDWAEQGAKCSVLPLVRKAIENFYEEQKPIGAICIAPVLIARVLGSRGVTLTLGADKEDIAEVKKTGAHHEICPVDDFITDRAHKIISTPAYMYGDAQPHQVFAGIQKLVRETVEMA